MAPPCSNAGKVWHRISSPSSVWWINPVHLGNTEVLSKWEIASRIWKISLTVRDVHIDFYSSNISGCGAVQSGVAKTQQHPGDSAEGEACKYSDENCIYIYSFVCFFKGGTICFQQQTPAKLPHVRMTNQEQFSGVKHGQTCWWLDTSHTVTV